MKKPMLHPKEKNERRIRQIYAGLAGAAALRLACLPPEAMVATKRLLKAAYMSGLSEQRKLEEEAASHLEGSAESKEAFSAFMEKRQPKFAE